DVVVVRVRARVPPPTRDEALVTGARRVRALHRERRTEQPLDWDRYGLVDIDTGPPVELGARGDRVRVGLRARPLRRRRPRRSDRQLVVGVLARLVRVAVAWVSHGPSPRARSTWPWRSCTGPASGRASSGSPGSRAARRRRSP